MNIQGQMVNVQRIWEGPEWNEIWAYLNVECRVFADLGLSQSTTDQDLWRLCQSEGLVLVTANRNQKRPDSLEAEIRMDNDETSLPVITVSDQEALRVDGEYARRVAIRILEYLFDVEKVCGAGRLYVP